MTDQTIRPVSSFLRPTSDRADAQVARPQSPELGRRLATIFVLSAILLFFPVVASHAATFCELEVTGVRISDLGRLQLRAHDVSEGPNDAVIVNLCNVSSKEGTVAVEACRAWHTELISALHTERTVSLQLRDSVLANENLGATCTDLTHHGLYWNAIATLEAK